MPGRVPGRSHIKPSATRYTAGLSVIWEGTEYPLYFIFLLVSCARRNFRFGRSAFSCLPASAPTRQVLAEAKIAADRTPALRRLIAKGFIDRGSRAMG
jgi:hypothetical protein